MTLYDEAAEKMVWIQLIDRDLVSVETMQERFGMIPEVEQMRMKREKTARENDTGKVPQKAGPFHNAQFEQDVTHTALQQGTLAPSEAGVKKKPRDKGDKSLLDHQSALENKRIEMEKESNEQKMQQDKELHEQNLGFKEAEHNQKLAQKDTEHKTMLPVKKKAMQQKLSQQNKGQPQQGRPKNSKDSTQRKKRRVLPNTKAAETVNRLTWAREAQKVISDEFTPIYLTSKGKKNVRSLSVAQTEELEALKFSILWNTPVMHGVTAEYVKEIDITSLPSVEDGIAEVAKLKQGYHKKNLSIDDIREIQVSAYILSKEGDTDAETED
jgi:hypothetical protein